jgi:FdhE protein
LSSQITPPTLLLPCSTLFATRAARLRQLATGHSLGPWLEWLALVCDAQQAQWDRLPTTVTPTTPPPQTPFLADARPALLASAAQIYHALVARLAEAGQLPPDAGLASEIELFAHLEGGLVHAAQGVPMPRWSHVDALCAAALQVVWSHATHQLGLAQESVAADASETCPCCGSLPVGSLIMAGDGKAGVRYLECCLCASRWHAVRAHCTLCDQSRGVSYLGLENAHPSIHAEVCEECHGYLKLFLQTKDILVDPVADDLASLALDVLVGEQGFARACPNLLMNDGEPVS